VTIVATTYALVADVAAHLNAQGPDGSSNYVVYGLKISGAAFQAHTDYANNYVNALLGVDLSSSDPKYVIAKAAAIHIACLQVLVISSGGALVGAYDYSLSDLHISRAGPYAAALQRTIQDLKEDIVKQLVNLSTVIKAAEAATASDVPTYRGGLMNP
jgi:hypothetical protein